MTTDQQIANELITRQLDVIRVETGLENDLQRQIGQLEKNIEALIAGVNLTALNKTQLKQLLKQIELAIDDFYSSCEEQIQQTINDIGDMKPVICRVCLYRLQMTIAELNISQMRR